MSRVRPVEILLVEANPQDVELTQRSLQKAKLANHIHVAPDGAEALEFILAPAERAAAGREEGRPYRP